MTDRNQGGVLVIWTGVTLEREALFNAWYNRQHLSERANVPGFRNGRRYHAVQGSPAYLAWYELDSPQVLASPAYADRQNNPTAWTQAVMPGFRDFTRVAGEVRARIGQGVGGACASWRLTPVPGQEQALAHWLAEEALPELMQGSSVVGAMLASPAEALTDAGPASAESKMREAPDNPPCWALIVETGDTEAARRVHARLNPTILAQHGVERNEPGVYTLITAVGEFENQPSPDPADFL